MKKSKKIIIAIIAVLAIVIIAALGVFQGELRTLLSVKERDDTGIYEVNYAADYKLDELLEAGGAATEEELVQYILKTMLKGLPIDVPYEIPNLACSTFIGENEEKGFVFGRNLDNQQTDMAVVRTAPKNGYKSVSCVNLSFLGYNETYTPDKLLDRINMLATAYFPLDGVNEKGLAIGVLQLQAPATAQDTDKPNVGTTLAIRAMLDKCASVREAVDFLKSVDMYAAAKGCYHFQIADASGDSVVVSYVDNEMVITEKTNGILCATNFYLHDVPFEYEKQGIDRYDAMMKNFSINGGKFELDEEMWLLQEVSIKGTEPDEKGRVYSTQWSAIYILENPELKLSVDRNYAIAYSYPVKTEYILDD